MSLTSFLTSSPRKRLSTFSAAGMLIFGLTVLSSQPALALKSTTVSNTSDIQVVGAEQNSADVQSILALLKDLLDQSNKHNLEGVLKHYSPRFVSGDNLSLKDIRMLIEDTWKLYPDIRYESKTQEIRVNGNWATVESMDTASATARISETVDNQMGELKSKSRGHIFLHRTGKDWEILSDHTMYERATILYGLAKGLSATISAPDQVFAGEPYTAKLTVTVPTGNVVVASIAKDPLVYPQRKPDDKFRTLYDNQTDLERVFVANTSNNNEIVTATIGLTQLGQDAEERPTIQFNGAATLVKRINVLPKTTYVPEEEKSRLVETSASGTVDLREKKLTRESSGLNAASDAVSLPHVEEQPVAPGNKNTPIQETPN